MSVVGFNDRKLALVVSFERIMVESSEEVSAFEFEAKSDCILIADSCLCSVTAYMYVQET